MNSKVSKTYLNSRVGRYMNIARPNGNSTELGNFYFCRHPNYLSGLSKIAESLYAINTPTGLCEHYSNISQVSPTNRTAIRRHLNEGSLPLFLYYKKR